MESRACDLLGGEWLLYWTSRDVPVPRGFLPQLDAWAGIDSRERALSIEPGTPILIDPAGRIDPRLAYFLRRSRFAFLAEESKNAYAKDYRLFFTFLRGNTAGPGVKGAPIPVASRVRGMWKPRRGPRLSLSR